MTHSAKEWWTLVATVQALKGETAYLANRLDMLVDLLGTGGTLSADLRARLDAVSRQIDLHITMEQVGSKEAVDPDAAPRVKISDSGVLAFPSESFVDNLDIDFHNLTQAALQAYKQDMG